MITRYESPEISKLWTDKAKFESYLKVEIAILKALEGNQIPKDIAKQFEENIRIDPKRIEEIEKETKHDVIAFCTSITEQVPIEYGKYFHFGVTSSDIIDSAWSLQIEKSIKTILPMFEKLLSTIFSRALETKDIICMGRSHGMFAEPMSFGGKLLGHFCEFARRYNDLKNFLENDLTVQFSGAVGNYTVLSPAQEVKAAQELGLKVETSSTQIIPRDRIAKLISINSMIASAIERLSVEIRHLHHSNLGELHEGFSKGQKGSSTMPHKKNPISGENLSGIVRVIKSHFQIALENNILWHERDISHSSAERMYIPDNLGLIFYALKRLNNTVKCLVFHQEKIESNVRENFTYLSSYYLHQLISKTELKREVLYTIIQEASFSSDNAISFKEEISKRLKNHKISISIKTPDFNEIKSIYLSYSDSIFQRAKKEFASLSLN